VKAVLVVGIVAALAHRADAYPQFQLSRESTCTGCHISPAGGLVLNENGLATAETMSTFGGAPEAAHGKLAGPSWLIISGDFRAGAGLNDRVKAQGAAFPMQAEVDGAVRGGSITLLATVGVEQGPVVASHEHWVMWQSEAGADHGLYVRAGRFMPVYGLRLAEHIAYTRRYGQTPLYGETYGAAVAYIDPRWEVHVTGFVHDRIQDPVERGDGAAAYGEVRLAKVASVGLQGRYAKSDEDARTAGGFTAKLWLEPANVLLQGEVQMIRQTFAAGSRRTQLVSYLLGSWFFHEGWMLDVGVGQFDEDLAMSTNDLECIDANVHWFATSHLELLLTNRVQTIGLGSGGATSGFTLLQIHYRL
jgi:hypothetical protein